MGELFAPHRAAAIIDTTAIAENYRVLKCFCEQKKPKNGAKNTPFRLISVVKADAYGHGAALAVPALLSAGCDFFAVATLEEALAVRAIAPVADVLILGYTPPREASTISRARLLQTVFSAEYAAALHAAAKQHNCTVSVHIKIDGGMCRLGFSPDDDDHATLLQLFALSHLRPVGIYTHFPSADHDLATTRYALSRFLCCKEQLEHDGLHLFCHAAASAALLCLPESVLDGARPGLALYGISPVETPLPLQPAMQLTAPIVAMRHVPAGTPVGYGGSFVTARPARIGVCPIGYADGLPRASAALPVRVLHENIAFSAPVAGHICMDQTMLDLTDTPAAIGDIVTFWSDPRPIATACGTIPYEILTAISHRVKRLKKEF